jgi:antitoxin HicB
MLIQWSDEDQAYIVTLPEFSDCRTHGETYEEAVKNGEEVLNLLIDTYRTQGKPLPEPQLLQVNCS